MVITFRFYFFCHPRYGSSRIILYSFLLLKLLFGWTFVHRLDYVSYSLLKEKIILQLILIYEYCCLSFLCYRHGILVHSWLLTKNTLNLQTLNCSFVNMACHFMSSLFFLPFLYWAKLQLEPIESIRMFLFHILKLKYVTICLLNGTWKNT